MSFKLKMGLSFLVQQCKLGGEAGTYAEVVLDSVPADTMSELLKLPDPIAYLANFTPEVASHRAWFEALMQECREMLSDETEAAPGNPSASPEVGS